MLRNFIYLFLMIVCIVSCSNDKHVSENYFDLSAFFQSEAKRLQKEQYALQKKMNFNQSTDETVITKPDWEKELAPFIEIDINKPSYNGRFDVIKTGNDLRYQAKDEQTDIKFVTIRLNDYLEVSKIEIKCEEKNNLYESDKTLVFVKDSMFIIKGNQKVKLLEPTSYEVNGFIKQSP